MAKVREQAAALGVDYIELRLTETLPPPFAAAHDFLDYLVINPRKSYKNVTTLSPMYQLATHTWKRLPLAITSILGPRLARYVP